MTAHEPIESRAAEPDAPPDLKPLLRTARRVKRALPPVQPSASFQMGLDDELQQVARRLALRRGTATRIVVERDILPASGGGLGLAVAAFALAGGLVGFAVWHRRRR